MTRPFEFKQFTLEQNVNAQKVGTDSMLLGAWVKGNFSRILDIGTGTGILALMMAQKNPTAQITAIEPDHESLEEARTNFVNSPYKDRLLPIETSLQQFGALEKFDLVISNPPYFENAYLSDNPHKNRARHTLGLQVYELYECVADLLDEKGQFSLIIPFEEEENHLIRASAEDLYPSSILRTTRDDGGYKRSLITFTFEDILQPEVSELLVKHSDNRYSNAYIQLTKDFYKKDLTMV